MCFAGNQGALWTLLPHHYTSPCIHCFLCSICSYRRSSRPGPARPCVWALLPFQFQVRTAAVNSRLEKAGGVLTEIKQFALKSYNYLSENRKMGVLFWLHALSGRHKKTQGTGSCRKQQCGYSPASLVSYLKSSVKKKIRWRFVPYIFQFLNLTKAGINSPVIKVFFFFKKVTTEKHCCNFEISVWNSCCSPFSLLLMVLIFKEPISSKSTFWTYKCIIVFIDPHKTTPMWHFDPFTH